MNHEYKYRVRKLCGNSGYEVKKAAIMPGAWKCEQVSKLEFRNPTQAPPRTVYVHVGFAEPVDGT